MSCTSEARVLIHRPQKISILRILPFDVLGTDLACLSGGAMVCKGPCYSVIQYKLKYIIQLPTQRGRLNRVSPDRRHNLLSHMTEAITDPVKESHCHWGIALRGHFNILVQEGKAVFETCNDSPWHSPTFISALPPHNSSRPGSQSVYESISEPYAHIRLNTDCWFRALPIACYKQSDISDMHVLISPESSQRSGAAKTHAPGVSKGVILLLKNISRWALMHQLLQESNLQPGWSLYMFYLDYSVTVTIRFCRFQYFSWWLVNTTQRPLLMNDKVSFLYWSEYLCVCINGYLSVCTPFFNVSSCNVAWSEIPFYWYNRGVTRADISKPWQIKPELSACLDTTREDTFFCNLCEVILYSFL